MSEWQPIEKKDKDGAALLPGDASASQSSTETLPTHAELVQIAGKWLKRQGCNVVLLERFAGNDHRGECPDAIGWWCSDFSSAVVECKVSIEDFRRDLRKPWRVVPPAMGGERWYLTPKGLLVNETIPTAWGVLEWNGRTVRIIRKPYRVPADCRAVENEAKLLLAELRIFHARGITYPKIGSGTPASPENSESTRRSEAQKSDA